VLSNLVLQLFIWDDCDGFEELLGYTDQSILGPGVEPINRGGVDQTWEHTRSETESITDG